MADDREDVYSKAVRAGKRTYFFDVKSTRGRDLYITITESKKHTQEDGSAHYEKHKIFLYKEDFDKFLEGYQDALAEIDRLRATGDYLPHEEQREPRPEQPQDSGSLPPRANTDGERFTDIDFEDLGTK